MAYQPTADEMRDAPKIKLGGKEFAIPLMGPRQNRKLVKIAMQFGTLAAGMKLGNAMLMGEDEFNVMMEAIHLGVSRAYPETTPEEMEDWPISVPEMVDALEVIFAQTGALKFEKGGASGEAGAGQQLTGTTSSPT